ncbi:hypothetical protein ACFQFH_17900 [Halobaculum halobium]|uniref:Uncharacterized protein n=1 Tax=Halobaculum halobium TaxID=3032281 RepID=A0ABD5THY6_9EURY|nr:hypothetical protein [Halobaculum sp. SYNS20]
MTDTDEHGVAVEEDTDLETAEDATSSKDDGEPPEEALPEQEPGRDDTDGETREQDAAEQENPDAHRDEEPYQS